MKLIAKTFHGLESVLVKEIEEIGGKNIHALKRAVVFEGSKEVMYKSNLHLRTALRILQPIFEFRASNENELYDKIYNFDWTKYFGIENTFAIDSVVNSEIFTHSKYVALKVKDAIVDQYRRKFHRRPNVDVQAPDVRINVHGFKDSFSISLDSSGDSLHKRGYRSNLHEAPINESLAAGLLALSEWKIDTPLIDPMCGSGTFLLEAAMMATNTPPGINQDYYGFMTWNNFERELWDKVREDALSKIKTDNLQIFGSDISAFHVKLATDAVNYLNFNDKIILKRGSFERMKPEIDHGTLIMNPPYGERLKRTDIDEFYKMIGDTLKQKYAGYDAWIISSNFGAMKHIGLKATVKHQLFNGPLEVTFNQYNIYSGTKKE